MPLSALIPITTVDSSTTTRLAQKIREDGYLRNPLAVAESSNGRYVIVDGAVRMEALRQLKVRDCVVQILNTYDPALVVGSWRHVVRDLRSEELISEARRLGLQFARLSQNDLTLGVLSHNDKAFVLTSDNKTLQFIFDRSRLEVFTETLRSFVESYSRNRAIVKVGAESGTAAQFKNFLDHEGFVILPALRRTELVKLIEAGQKLPPHYVHCSFPNRYLGVKVSLDILSDSVTTEKKNEFLDDLIKVRMSLHRATFYPQSVFLMND